jgi:hypothetical protein
MPTKGPRVVQHYLEFRIVAIYGAVYFFALAVASVLFYQMVTSQFAHLIFWSWCLWSFVTAYCFYIFMRSLMGPAVQIYDHVVVLNHPKRRHIMKGDVRSVVQENNKVKVTFMENGSEKSITVPVRPRISFDSGDDF